MRLVAEGVGSTQIGGGRSSRLALSFGDGHFGSMVVIGVHILVVTGVPKLGEFILFRLGSIVGLWPVRQANAF